MFRTAAATTSPFFARRLLAATPKPPWYTDEPLLFKCTGCGKCCSVDGAVYVNAAEIAALATAKKMELKDFEENYVGLSEEGDGDDLNPSGSSRSIILDRAPDKGGGCALLNEDGRTCSVYDARPIQCATYPFWPGILASRETWIEEAEYCEGLHVLKYNVGDAKVPADARDAPDARVPREEITANLTVVSLLEADVNAEGGGGAGQWSYDEARAAVDAAIASTPALLDELELDLYRNNADERQ